jgi:hypothetical protein
VVGGSGGDEFCGHVRILRASVGESDDALGGDRAALESRGLASDEWQEVFAASNRAESS